jgi:PGF-pre-PGF domain-containing protein
VYPNASAYYCYRLADSAGGSAYSPTQYVNVPYICAPPSVYNATTMGCWSPSVVISTSSVSASYLQNVSSSLGIPVNVLLALSNGYLTGAANTITIECAGCTGAGTNAQGITTISTNSAFSANLVRRLITSINASSSLSLANALSTNSMLLKQFVSNSTPTGFSVVNNSTMLEYRQNAAGVGNSVTIAWSSSGATGYRNISVASIKRIATNQSSITPSQLGAQYALNYLANTSSISVTSHTEVHASSVVNGNNGTTQYVPSNVTVYGSMGGTAVVSVTNLVRNASNYVNTTIPGRMPLRSMVVVPRKNITALAAGITTYNSISSSSAATGIIASNANSGNVIGVIVVRSSVNDSLISAVQYKFNVSRALLAAKGTAPQSVRLYRQNVTAARWVALPTNLTGSNSTQYFYTAASPGMSVYMIGLGYIEANITENKTTSAPFTPTLQTTMVGPLTIVVIMLLAAAMVIVYLTLFRKGRPDDNPPEPPSAGPQAQAPQTTDEAMDAYIKAGQP